MTFSVRYPTAQIWDMTINRGKDDEVYVSIPVSLSLNKALFVVCRIQKVALYDSNDTNTFIVGL